MSPWIDAEMMIRRNRNCVNADKKEIAKLARKKPVHPRTWKCLEKSHLQHRLPVTRSGGFFPLRGMYGLGIGYLLGTW